MTAIKTAFKQEEFNEYSDPKNLAKDHTSMKWLPHADRGVTRGMNINDEPEQYQRICTGATGKESFANN